MNKIDFLTEVKDWFEGKFGTDPAEQAKKVADAHLDAYVDELYEKSTGGLGVVKTAFKNHFHLANTVSGLQAIVADLSKKVESLLPSSKPVKPDIGGNDVE